MQHSNLFFRDFNYSFKLKNHKKCNYRSNKYRILNLLNVIYLLNWVRKSGNLYNGSTTEIFTKHGCIDRGTHDNQLQFRVCLTSSS